METAEPHIEIDFFLLADRAEAIGGKLYALGAGWDRYTLADMSQPAFLSFALGVLAPPTQVERQRIVEITIRNATTGERIPKFAVKAGFRAHGSQQVDPDLPVRVLLALPLVPVRFSEPGLYEAVARIDGGAAERTVKFRVVGEPPMK